MEEITTQSWGSRLLNSFFGILIGIILIIAAFVLIFWNEGHGLHVAQSLQQAEKVLITVPNAPINNSNNLKVVYFTGTATTNEILSDPTLGVSNNAIRLRRDVQMYQWKENVESRTEEQVGGSVKHIKTYSYEPVWSSTVIDSREFKNPNGHTNPASMPLSTRIVQASNVSVGDFVLPRVLVDNIDNETPYDLTNLDINKLQIPDSTLPITHNDGGLYIGKDVRNPVIGDVKINLYQVLPQPVSIIAQQVGSSLQPFIAPAGQPVSIIVAGEVSPQQMIYREQMQNRALTWLLRLVSLLMMMGGVALILQPFVVLADFIPFIGRIVGFGTGVIAFVVGLFLWGIGTGIAWFVVRPLYGIAMVGIICLVCYLIIKRRRNKLPKPSL